MSVAEPHRVVAGVLLRDGRALLCRRRDDLSWYPGVWDLVGGHVEPGETATQALVRECREELGVEIGDIGESVHVMDAGMELTVFRVRDWAGDPVNAAPEEHQEIGWFDAGEIRGLALADARLQALLRDALAAP
jgi:8-oxo-dGTP diphosphatase